MRDDLTRTETAYLRDHAPPEVRRFASEIGPKTGIRVEAYRKIAAAAYAERMALSEVRRLDLARLDGDPQGHLDRVIRERGELKSENERLREQVTVLRALPSMAVHSDD